jgi:glutathione S-transferase
MQPYKLHCFGESGHSYKVALYLETNAIPWEPVLVDFFIGETRSDQFREQVNEMGEAPVLVFADKKLSQSGAILTYLAATHKKHDGKSPEEQQEILRWILFDNHKLSTTIGSLRFLVTIMKSGETPVTEWLRGRALGALKVLDKHMAKQHYVAGPRLTIADYSLCGYLFYGEELPFDLSQFENVKAWLDRIRALPRWKHPYDLMPRKSA